MHLLGRSLKLTLNPGTATEKTILNVTNSFVTVPLKSVGVITVVPVDINYVVSSSEPYMPREDQECDRYYAPVFIMVSLVGSAIIAGVIGFIVMMAMKKGKKSEEFEEANPEDIQLAEQPSGGAAPVAVHAEGSQRSSNLRVDVPDERSDAAHDEPPEILVSVPAEQPQAGVPAAAEPQASERPLVSSGNAAAPSSNRSRRPKPAEKQEEEPGKITFKEVLAGHYLLGLFICGRAFNLLLLVTVLLSELFFLGVFYYFLADSHWDGTETSMSYLFESYGKDDVLYYIWSFVITFIISLILTTLFNPVWVREQKARKVSIIVGCALCAALIVLFIILIVLLNIAVCYEYAGRWSVGFLWEFLTEVLIIEFVVMAYRWALLMLFRPKA